MSQATRERPEPVLEHEESDPAHHHPWEWARSLASAEPGRRYRVDSAAFSLVRQRCRELGCVEGAEVLCVANGPFGVTLATEDGDQFFLERVYAWFVHAEEP